MKKQEIPKFHETFNPILEVLSSGEILKSREMANRVIEKFYGHLPKDLLEEQTKSGEILIFNRINWGKSYLKKGGYIHYPKRGHVEITPKGLKQKSALKLKDLESETNMFDFYSHEKKENLKGEPITEATPQDLIDSGFKQIDAEVKKELLDRLKETDPYYFEKVVLRLLKKMGYGDFQETSKSGDGGIDGVINQDQLGLDKIFIQSKRYTDKKVRELEIRNFIGAMSGDTNKGIFVTTSFFDKNAEKKAREAHHTIILVDGNKLVDLMHHYGVGVQVKETYVVKEIDDDFFEGS
ncbi:MAG: restriction endonuclease [Bacteroidia bacterium]